MAVTTRPNPTPTPETETRDLGFGSIVARESRQRLLNRDGTFNVRRKGTGFLSEASPYHALLTMSWPRFLFYVTAGYLIINALFAGFYLLCGDAALAGPSDAVFGGRFLRAFFFSVETFATIGYGQLAPQGVLANVIVVVESLVGLLAVALATGVIFARFSRPSAQIVFSRNAVLAPYRGGTGFEFRIVNARNNQLIEVEVKVLYSRIEGGGPRRFYPLTLERSKVVFFPLSWTVVHPIDEASPIRDATEASLLAENAEFLVLLTATDDTVSQSVHARSSYKAQEVVWGAKFLDIFERTHDGDIRLDVNRVHELETV